ncbi:hypothetical protein IU449_19020 [Nocardia higoensis]|uniref:Uncharacterized protein n=1 Tax=Nocardia higoensis TaxID=228599 RepID=A0ABS0DDT9_9NOCA|nr:hypothetical protein [Nocardia higoensis]MBF6356610.1 hypothetical protein [Nocardia higoensis]
MPGTVLIRRVEPDLWSVAPPGAPTVLDPAPALDTTVLEVLGGHLSWSLLSGQRLPAAILHDPASAQDWLWAIYGESVAVALHDHTEPVELPAEPHLHRTATAARRLAYAHWAARWWPASTLDGIPALDRRLLDDEIARLIEECDLLVDGDDARPPVRELAAVPASARAEEYALAAGEAAGDQRGALTFTRGSGGWDWRRCPPGLVDASEQAVSWELTRTGGLTAVRVRAVAAPGITPAIPGYLRPHAAIDTGEGTVDTALELFGDTWQGLAEIGAQAVARVEVYVPGVGPATADPVEPATRGRIRALVAERLRRAAEPTTGDSADSRDTAVTSGSADTSGAADSDDAEDAPLLAEIAAAAEDSDF